MPNSIDVYERIFLHVILARIMGSMVFVICVEAMIHLLLYNSHDCTWFLNFIQVIATSKNAALVKYLFL